MSDSRDKSDYLDKLQADIDNLKAIDIEKAKKRFNKKDKNKEILKTMIEIKDYIRRSTNEL